MPSEETLAVGGLGVVLPGGEIVQIGGQLEGSGGRSEGSGGGRSQSAGLLDGRGGVDQQGRTARVTIRGRPVELAEGTEREKCSDGDGDYSDDRPQEAAA